MGVLQRATYRNFPQVYRNTEIEVQPRTVQLPNLPTRVPVGMANQLSQRLLADSGYLQRSASGWDPIAEGSGTISVGVSCYGSG
ncbi:MAG: hypothetical protein RL215_2917 [Planctomycetota bacterium]